MRQRFVHAAPGLCLAVFLAGCGGGSDSGSGIAPPPSEETGLSVVGPQQSVSTQEGEPVEFEIKVQNAGAKTAKNIRMSTVPSIFSVVQDNCSGKPLAPAANCTLKLELYDDKVESGVLPLQFVYDYADKHDRSASGDISYAVSASQWRSVAEWGGHNGDARNTGFVHVTLKPEWFSERWSVSPLSGQPLKRVSIGAGKVFVTPLVYSGEQELKAINLNNGTAAWNYKFGTVYSLSSAAYADGRVYVNAGANLAADLWAFNAEDGAIEFRSQTEGYSTHLAPAVLGGNVYINGGLYGGIYRFNGTNGDRIWHVSFLSGIYQAPAADEKYAYMKSGSNFSVFSKIDGSIVFEVPVPRVEFQPQNSGLGAAPTLGESGNVLLTDGGRLISFDTINRRIGWQKTAKFSGQVSLAKGEIYVFNDGKLDIRRESDGELLGVWAPPSGQWVYGCILVTNNLLFVGTKEATYGVDRLTREVVWSVNKPGRHLSLSNEGKLIIADYNGMLTAVDLRYRRP